jgi:hypothetical protein
MGKQAPTKLETIQSRIEQYDMRFPGIQIAEATGYDTGYISAVLNGKKPISDKFWSIFEQKFPVKQGNGQAEVPPPYIQVSWQDYMKLIHFSLEQLMAGQNEILKQQAKTRAEVRGYGKYHLVKDAKGSREKFDKLLAEVDKLVNDDLQEDHGQDNPAGR